jgi:hypothetical protein
MVTMNPAHTEDHPVPSLEGAVKPWDALVLAYPRPGAISMPVSGVLVGRHWLADHGIDDCQVSGQHFVVRRRGALQIEDAGSRNGTWVNGHRLAPGERVGLEDGFVVRVGSTVLIVRTGFVGSPHPSPPVYGLVAPYGLRSVAEQLESFRFIKPSTVLVEGETGTGKELVARGVAEVLGRGACFVPVNVAAVPAGVFESQLFGYVKGAFSGAGTGAPGIVASHDGGAVFFDEIGELHLDLQPKLLRLIENREVFPVGAHRPRPVDVVIVAATNRDLGAMVAEGKFRQDLMARLAAAVVELPPLRERPEDLFAIATWLAEQRGRAFQPQLVEVEAVEHLVLHAWPGNVRELAAVIDRVQALAQAPALPLWAMRRVLPSTTAHTPGVLTASHVQQVLASCGGNESQAARMLGVSRGKLRRFRAEPQR